MVILFRIMIIALLLSAAEPFPLLAAALPEGGELLLKADNLVHEQNNNIIRASGNVELIWSAARLYAALATYYGAEDLLTAAGGVRLEKDGDTVSGDSVSIRIGSQQGTIANGRIFVKNNNLYISGKEIKKTGDQDYTVRSGSITSCDGEKPGWKFRVDELDVTLDHFAFGRNAFFYLGDVPVFWFPYLVFPVKTEKQSGLLLPHLGHSTKKGFFLEFPYYWDISPSSDATIALDLQSRRGAGAALEYRYRSSNGGEGTSRGYLIYDTDQTRIRGNLELQQQINFTRDTYWRADAALVLDRNFYRDYGILNGDYNRQYLATTAFLSHRSNDMLLTGGAVFLDNLDAPSNRETLQRLPFLTLMGSGSRIAETPLYYSFNSSVTRFDRSVGSSGERFSLAPRLTLQQTLYPGLSGRLWAGYNQRFYTGTGADADLRNENGLLEGGGSVQAEFSRTFAVNVGNTTGLNHRIVPELSYEYRERRDQSRLPFYDYDDRLPGGQMLTATFHNYLTGKSVNKEATAYRDLMTLTVSQGYQLKGDRRDLLVLVDEGKRFADTGLRAEISPSPLVTIQSDNRISPYSGSFTNASLGLVAGEVKGDSLGLSWHHAKGLLDYLEGRINLTALQPFTFSALGRYSFDRPGFLEKLYTAEYKQQCWSLLLAYRDRIDNQEITFSFNLSGLGTFKML